MAETIRAYLAEGKTQIVELTLYGYSAADADTVRKVVDAVLPS